MNRRTAVLALAAVLLVAAAGAPFVATAASGGDGANDDIAPGARLAGVVGVGQAELQGDVASRALDHRLSTAESPDTKAAVVADSVSELRDRLRAIEADRQRLVEAHQNGSMPDGEFRARMAALAARSAGVSQRLNVTAETAGGLPEDVLAAHGVNASAIDRLRTNAANLTGPEVAAIAHTITGKASPPGSTGSPAAKATVSAAATQVAQARSAVREAANRTNPPANLDAARSHLDAAEAALQDARAALADGDASAARESAKEARAEARAARTALRGNGGNGTSPGDDAGGDHGRNGTGKPDDPGA